MFGIDLRRLVLAALNAGLLPLSCLSTGCTANSSQKGNVRWELNLVNGFHITRTVAEATSMASLELSQPAAEWLFSKDEPAEAPTPP